MEHWKLENGRFGNSLTLFVEWKDSFNSLLERESVQELVLLTPQGFERHSLDFLSDLSWLKSFTLLDLLIEDIDGVHSLGDLQALYMGDYSGMPIDFARFPNLRECRMEFNKRRVSVNSCTGLELLSLQHYSYSSLSPLTSLRGLEHLDIAQGSLGDISDISAFQGLRTLSLVLLRNLSDVSPISSLKMLERLELEGSKNFGRLDPLSDLSSLKILNIANCGEIESLAPLLGCKSLQVLQFSEDTNILDGDLSVLLQMPNLKHVALRNRKHYNMKREELPMFGAPYPEELKYRG